jgi:hypothetical protein
MMLTMCEYFRDATPGFPYWLSDRKLERISTGDGAGVG